MALNRCMTTLAVLIAFVLPGICSTPRAESEQHPSNRSAGIAQSLPAEYRQWLDQDVQYIITPQERAEFLRLSKNEDRDRFVEQFWERRDPVPGATENKFKEEHYRRIAYANTHFAAGTPGWRTDRGRIYILYGPPDEIKTQSDRGSVGLLPPRQTWHYHSSIPGYGNNADLKFVDWCACGEYRLQPPPGN
ncbi:MAG: GWxTD domain-containing protein [Terriglobales bacterium]